MTKVLVVGMAVIDFIFEVESMPDSAEKYAASGASIIGGGGAANAACAIARLGGDAMLAARIGADMIGQLIVEDLEKYSVDCSLINTSEEGRSSYSSVLVDSNGERQIVNYRGAGLSDNVDLIEQSKPDAVLADNRWKAGAKAAMRLASNNKLAGVLDAEAPVDTDLLQLASHIAFSRQGLQSIAGELNCYSAIESALRDIEKKYSGWIAMTDGGAGVFSLNDGQFVHHPASVIEVVDTLGAGDVWHGAFTYALASGHNETIAVEFANATATLKCGKAGGGRACPDLAEVERFVQDSKHTN